jgi:hypothetical protein
LLNIKLGINDAGVDAPELLLTEKTNEQHYKEYMDLQLI